MLGGVGIALDVAASDRAVPRRPRPVEPASIAVELAHGCGRWRRHLRTDTAARSGLRLAGTEDFDAWLLAWPPGMSVAPHDHGESGGAFTVVDGTLVETRWYG